MLVLGRKRGETIHIGDTITITILRARGNYIRIGIDAPDEFRIVRGELNEWSKPACSRFPSAYKSCLGSKSVPQ